ncbi:MAG: beta-galactosidase, partial [Candidatus Omnitrophica bacterium]|nr:beta-galactosidase [Candidatus Omnitrophota bacterium]
MRKAITVIMRACLLGAFGCLFGCFSLLAGDVVVATTFSQVQCEYLGQDWKEIYLKTLDLGFDMVRLGAYWSRIEAKEGVYDFSELDWQIEKAAEKGVRVLLTVGMKAPRWPEYFIPVWLTEKIDIRYGSDSSEAALLQASLFKFIEQVVLRYRDKDIIVAWQVENEPLSRSGPKDLWIGRKFLEREMALVRGLDTKDRPLVVNAMTYSNGFLRFLARLAHKKSPIME